RTRSDASIQHIFPHLCDRDPIRKWSRLLWLLWSRTRTLETVGTKVSRVGRKRRPACAEAVTSDSRSPISIDFHQVAEGLKAGTCGRCEWDWQIEYICRSDTAG